MAIDDALTALAAELVAEQDKQRTANLAASLKTAIGAATGLTLGDPVAAPAPAGTAAIPTAPALPGTLSGDTVTVINPMGAELTIPKSEYDAASDYYGLVVDNGTMVQRPDGSRCPKNQFNPSRDLVPAKGTRAGLVSWLFNPPTR